jgi:hypothetical protein
MPVDFDYPISAFRAAARHLVGRIAIIVAALSAAVLLGAGIASGWGDYIAPLGALMIYPVMIIGGFYSLWGALIYPTIVFCAAIYILRETSHLLVLLIFVLQAAEACRWSLSWTIGEL